MPIRKSKRHAEPREWECARCGRIHRGDTPPAGWGFAPGQGKICDDCEESLRLGAITGMEARNAA